MDLNDRVGCKNTDEWTDRKTDRHNLLDLLA